MSTILSNEPDEIPKLQLNHLSNDFTIEEGLCLRAGPTVFRIHEIIDSQVILEHAVSLERRLIPLPKLLAEIGNCKVQVCAPGDVDRAVNGDIFEEDDLNIIRRLPLNDLSDAQKNHVLRVMRYIEGLRRRGYTKLVPSNPTIQLDLDRIRAECQDPQPVRASWIYKWSLELDRAGGDPRAVIPRFDSRGGKGGKRLDPAIEEATTRVLSRLKSDPKAAVKTKKVLDDIRSVISIEHPQRPELNFNLNWSTIDRRVHEYFSEYELCRRNQGKEAADKKFRDWYPRDRAEFPLEVIETDDTDAVVFLIDDRSGLPFGRAFLTATIDQSSLAIPSIELSEQPRSSWSAISAIIKAMLPKDMSDPDFAETRSGCEFYGKPGIIVFDNALYNHANEIEEAARSIGVIPTWARPFRPTEKSYQEGWNALLKQDALPSLPGCRGDKKLREGLKEGVASANIGMLAFCQHVLKWTYDKYCNNERSGGLTPRQRWHMGMRFSKPRLPVDIHGLKLVPCLHKTLKFRPEGILFQGIIYSIPFIQLMKKRYGHNAEVKFRYNPGNLGEIYVFNPSSKVYIPVPATNPEYAKGLTLFQDKLILKMARANGIRNPSIPQLLRCREELRLLTEQLRFSKKLQERKRAKRTGDIPENTDTENKRPPETECVVVTDLEDRILDIMDVEMDGEDEGWTFENI